MTRNHSRLLAFTPELNGWIPHLTGSTLRGTNPYCLIGEHGQLQDSNHIRSADRITSMPVEMGLSWPQANK